MRRVLDKVVEKMKTHILFSITFFFRKSCSLWANVEKYGGARGHKWRHSMTQTQCMLDKQSYTRVRECTRLRAQATTHPHARKDMHALMRLHTHTYTQTDKYVILIANS
jgi:hypothetical protein